jgi:hypothetical protein
MKELIKRLLKEGLTKCYQLHPTKEVIGYVSKFNSEEELLRSGGLPTDMLNRYAFGFSESDLTQIHPSRITIRWFNDKANVEMEVKESGLTPLEWSKQIDLSEPVEVSYQNRGHGLKFYLEDGHHRHYAATILDKELNVKVTIKANPINRISRNRLGYDDFMRCLFKQIK